jgi:hypothetical protein
MKKIALFAAVAGLGLVSAAPDPQGGSLGGLGGADPGPAPKAAPAPKAKVAPAPAPAPRPVLVPKTARSDYPPCSATVRDRCMQGRGGYRAERVQYAERRRIRMAGERG